MEKKQLYGEMLQRKSKEVENLKEKMMATPKKTKYGRKATEDDESSCRSNEGVDKETDLGTILIGTISVSLNCSSSSLTFQLSSSQKK